MTSTPAVPELTIASIRDALPPEHREQFAQEVERTPAAQLATLLGNWRAVALALAIPNLNEILAEPVDLDTATDASGHLDRGAA